MRLLPVTKTPKPESGRDANGIYRIKKNTIKQILLRAGLSEKKIAELRDSKRIVITPNSLGSTLTAYEDLFIVDLEEPTEPLNSLDRFKDLT